MAGVRRTGSFCIEFDAHGYLRALKNAITKVTAEMQKELYHRTRAKAQALPYKDNPVRLANGRFTSDADRADAVINSVVNNGLEWVARNVVSATVTALEKYFNKSFIGLFYEYGTGKNADIDTPFFALGDWNPYRLPVAGAPIVTRSKHVNGGVWTDLGGNKRITYSPRGGERDADFVKYIGEDIEAHHWFREAFEEVKDEVLENYRRVVYVECHVSKFIKLLPTIVLGGGGHR